MVNVSKPRRVTNLFDYLTAPAKAIIYRSIMLPNLRVSDPKSTVYPLIIRR